MRNPPLLLITAFMVLSGFADAAGVGTYVHPQDLQDTQRWLRAIKFGDGLQARLSRHNPEGHRARYLERLIKSSPVEIEAVVAPVFAEMLRSGDARLLWEFYESPVGLEALDPTPPSRRERINPTDDEMTTRFVILQFRGRGAGLAGENALHDPGVRQRYMQRLREHFKL
jgi:hypothetical protein